MIGTQIISVARKAKRSLKSLLGMDLSPKIDGYCHKGRFGSQYGGWDVATGYIDKNSIVYSFGVGEDASFDTALIERFNLTIHAFDPTPKSIEWVKNQVLPTKFIFHVFGIAGFDGIVSFNPPENPDHVSHTILSRPETEGRSISVPVKRLATIMKELEHSKIDILKMDVEGAEYEVIMDIEKSDIRPQQILIEFHHRFPNVGIKKTRDAIKSLRKIGYSLFSVSSTVTEFCFISKKS